MPKNYSPEEYTILQQVGEIMLAHRKRCDLTQEQAAERASINVTYLSDIERGKRNLSLINIARLAEAYGVKLEDVFKAKNNM